MKTVMTFLDFKNEAITHPSKYTLADTEPFRDTMLGIIGFEFDDSRQNTFIPVLFTKDAIKTIVRNHA